MKNLTSLICFSILAVLFFSGCGGNSSGGGSTPDRNTLLNDTYFSLFTDIDNNVELKDYTYNGDGTGTYDSGVQSFSYSVNSDFTVTGTDSTGTEYGIMTTDGSFVFWIGDCYLELQSGKLTGAETSDLYGAYNYVYIDNSAGMGVQYSVGTVWYDGVDKGEYNSSIGDTKTSTFGYSVASDGRITITVADNIAIMSENADMVIRMHWRDVELNFKVLSGASVAYLAGEYNSVMIATGGIYGMGKVTYDGAGNGTYQYNMGSSDSGTFTYAVNPTGIITATSGGSDSYGIMNSDGSMVAIVGSLFLEIQTKI